MPEANPYQVTTACLDVPSPVNAGSLGFRLGLLFAAPVAIFGLISTAHFFWQRNWEMATHGFLLLLPSCILVLCGYWWATSGASYAGWVKVRSVCLQSVLICSVFLGSTAFLSAGVSGYKRVELGLVDVGPSLILFVLVGIYCGLLATVTHRSLKRGGIFTSGRNKPIRE